MKEIAVGFWFYRFFFFVESEDVMSDSKRQEIADILKELEESVTKIFESEYYLETFLKTYSKFHNYSLNNVIWIMQQRPEAERVASFATWKKVGRHVKKGAKGIKVLVPVQKKIVAEREIQNADGTVSLEENEYKKTFFKVGHTFDVADTEGEDLPTLVHQLEYDSDFISSLISQIKDNSEVPICIDEDVAPFGKANGYYSLVDKDIHVRADISGLHMLKTIIHELSHSIQETEYEEVKEFDRNKKEVVAEATAYTTMKMLQSEFQIEELDSSEYSFGYICGWSTGKELSELKETLKLIGTISNKIFDWIVEISRQSLVTV